MIEYVFGNIGGWKCLPWSFLDPITEKMGNTLVFLDHCIFVLSFIFVGLIIYIIILITNLYTTLRYIYENPIFKFTPPLLPILPIVFLFCFFCFFSSLFWLLVFLDPPDELPSPPEGGDDDTNSEDTSIEDTCIEESLELENSSDTTSTRDTCIDVAISILIATAHVVHVWEAYEYYFP